MNSHIAQFFSCLSLLLSGWMVHAADPEAVTATGVKGGLCVVVLPGNAPQLTALSCDGRFVVQGLAPANEVDAIRANIPVAMGGLASVQAWEAVGALPYADNLVDLLVVDRDALGAGGPADAELLRVVAPAQGAIWQKKGGIWSKLTKPMPNEYGEWTHYFYDATNNPVSRDTAVKVPTSMQWLADSLADPTSQNQLISGAGDHAVIATVPTGKDSNVHLRPLATIQIADLKTGAVLSSFETKPGVIENGMAVAQGRCFVVLDDGSLVAYG